MITAIAPIPTPGCGRPATPPTLSEHRRNEQGSLMQGRNIGFIGAGQMARALAQGWRHAGLIGADNVIASDLAAEARDLFSQLTGGRAVAENAEVVRAADCVVLAVKPQTVDAVLSELSPLVEKRHLIISIAAGVTLRQLEAGLGGECRLVRVMPNTPCLVGASASGYSLGKTATAEDAAFVQELFSAVGLAVTVPEHLLDAVTGLSGSGPAYIFQVIEAMSDGGVRAGLPRSVAMRLAAQTVLGAARMVLETGEHPAALKDNVTSPAGTTIAGLAVLEARAVRGAFIDAITAASERARQLGAK